MSEGIMSGSGKGRCTNLPCVKSHASYFAALCSFDPRKFPIGALFSLTLRLADRRLACLKYAAMSDFLSITMRSIDCMDSASWSESENVLDLQSNLDSQLLLRLSQRQREATAPQGLLI